MLSACAACPDPSLDHTDVHAGAGVPGWELQGSWVSSSCMAVGAKAVADPSPRRRADEGVSAVCCLLSLQLLIQGAP